MTSKIAILYTTFLRNDLAFKTIQSIQPFLNEHTILLIADQNLPERRININPNWHYTINYSLPFDCWLSYARNFLVDRAKDFGYDYSIISADSIQFIKDTENLTSAIKYLSENTNIGLVGFNLNDRQAWEGYIDLIPNLYFKIKQLNLQQDDCFLFEGLRFYPCEVIRNFFLAKTECLINNKWDENLKLGEHEDYFYRLKQTQWTVNYCPDISANYINEKPEEYLKYRQRMYSEFR